MCSNMGMKDRAFRIIVGFALMSQAFVVAEHPLFLLGFFPALIGASGWCPAFSLINWSTMNEAEMKEQYDRLKQEEKEYDFKVPHQKAG